MPAAVGSTIGQLKVVIGADTAGLKRGVASASTALKGISKVAGIATNAIGALGLAVPLTGAGLMAMSVSTINAIDSMSKMADQLGVTSESLGGLRHAADQMAGMADGQFDNALRRMTRRLAQAADGSGAASDAIKKLGLSAQDLATQTPDQQIREIADAMQNVSSQGERLKIAFDVFGREGQTMVNMLKDGAAGLDEMQAEAEKLGLALNDIQVAKAQQAADAIGRMGAIMRGIQNQIAIEVAPYITALAEAFNDAATSGTDFGKIAANVLRMTAKGFAIVGDAVVVVQGAIKALNLVVAHVGNAFIQVFSDTANAVTFLIDNVIMGAIHKVAEGINALTGTNIQIPKLNDAGFKKDLDAFAAKSQTTLNEVQADFDDWTKNFLDTPWFTEQVDDFFDDFERRAAEAAANRGAPTGGGDSEGGGVTTGKGDKQADDLQKRLDALRDFTATAEDINFQANQKRLEDLEAVNQAGMVSTQEYYDTLQAIGENFYEKQGELEEEKFNESAQRLQELHDAGIIGDQEYKETLLERQREYEDTMTELLVDAFEQRKEILDELREAGEIDEEEYRQRRLEAEEELQQNLTAVAARGAKDRAKDVEKLAAMETRARADTVSAAVGFLDQLAGKSKAAAIAAIALHKGLAIAKIAVTTAENAELAFGSQLIVGDPSSLGRAFAAAAAVKARGATQMALVAATGLAQAAGVVSSGTGGLQGGASGSIGGNSSAPSSNAGNTTTTDIEPAPKHSVVTINLQGEIFNRQQVRDLIEQINESVADGSTLRLD